VYIAKSRIIGGFTGFYAVFGSVEVSQLLHCPKYGEISSQKLVVVMVMVVVWCI
jgi:hypothetical protein